MSVLFRTVALLFALAWVPATLHCHLAAIFAVELETCAHGHESSGAEDSVPFDADKCDVVEDGDYRQMLLPPACSPGVSATLIADLLELPSPRVLGPVSSEDFLRSELARTWQFQRRAAPPSRAPALLA